MHIFFSLSLLLYLAYSHPHSMTNPVLLLKIGIYVPTGSIGTLGV
jgi:hypothetical protein